MAVPQPLTNAQAPEAARALFLKVQASQGVVINLWRTMGHAPAVLEATLAFSSATKHDLDPKLRELAFLKTSRLNDCHY